MNAQMIYSSIGVMENSITLSHFYQEISRDDKYLTSQ